MKIYTQTVTSAKSIDEGAATDQMYDWCWPNSAKIECQW